MQKKQTKKIQKTKKTGKLKSVKKIKILQIIPSMKSGGIERGVVEESRALVDSADFEVVVVSSGGGMVAHLRDMGVKHIQLPVHSKNPFVIRANIQRLVNIIKNEGIDIVNVRSRAPAWSAYYACKEAGCKLVTTVHGSYSFGWKLFSGLKKKYNSSMLLGDKIIVVSRFIKDYILDNYELARLKKKQIEIVHRGVDIDIFNPDKISMLRILQAQKKINLPEDKKIIVLPGRLTSWKGQEFLIDALAKVKNDNYFCLMIGDDKGHEGYRQRLEKKIIENGLEGKIRIVSHTNDLSAVYWLSSIVVSASVRPEAFGRIAVEGQAMKRVVVATAIGGSLETIIDGKTGLLVEPKNVDDFAKKLDFALLMGKDKVKKMTDVASKHVRENFSIKKMCDSTLKIYKQMMK
jgi:glycosyltransferase involved in cell wall biosynthesis